LYTYKDHEDSMPRAETETLRQRILTAAVELLGEHGPRGLSQPRVAKRAGIPQGHLTYYFPKKSDLLAAVARRIHDDTEREIIRMGSRLGPRTFHDAASEFMTKLVRDSGRSRTLLGLLVASEEDERLRSSLRGIVDEGRLAIGVALGRERDDPAIDLVLALSWGLQVEQLLYRRSPQAVGRLVDALLEWLGRLQGVESGGKKARPRKGGRRS
jgi:AcrR family transcriptional regulator